MALPPVATNPSEPAPTTGAVEPAIQPLVVPRSAIPSASLVTPAVPSNLVLGTGTEGISPAIDSIRRRLLAQTGIVDAPRDPMTGDVAAPLSAFAEAVQKFYPASRQLPRLFPEFRGGLSGLPEAEPAPITVDWTSISLALRSGLDESPLGSLLRTDQLRKALTMNREPGYDYFTDRQIFDAGYGDQMTLFNGTQSRETTRWMIQRLQEKARTAEYIDRMGTAGAVAKFAGGILGDPITYLPPTLGLKSAEIAGRLARGAMTGTELKMITQQGVAWGTISETMANMTLQAGAHVMSRLAQATVDPTTALDDVLDSMFLPVAIGGSAQFVTSAFNRFGMRSLKADVRNADFLRGRMASGARYVPDDFVGPVIHPSEEAAAALASRYDEAARRMEATNIFMPAAEARTRPGLAGDSDYVKGKFGPQSQPPYNGLPRNGEFFPGALATNYGPLRRTEFFSNPQNAPFLRHTADFEQFMAGNKLVDEAGQPLMVFHGTPAVFDQFDPARFGSRTGRVGAREGLYFTNDPKIASGYAMPDSMAAFHAGQTGQAPNVRPSYLQMKNPLVIEQGDVARVDKLIAKAKAEGHDGLILKGGEGGRGGVTKADSYIVFKPEQVRGFDQRFDVDVPTVSKRRLVDQVFKPGELERAGAPTTTHADVAKLPGTTRMRPASMLESVKAGTQQGYVVLPDGKIFELGEGFTGPGGLVINNGARGLHNAFFAHFPDLTQDAMRLTRFGDELAADVPTAGRTEQQTATLRALKSQWDRAGLGDRIRFDTADLVEPPPAPGSVGAQLSPASQVYRREVLLAQGRMAPTGIGMENLPLDPVSRTFQGLSVAAMQLVSDLVSTGGRLTVGNLGGLTMGIRAPIEMLLDANWGKPVVDLVRRQHDAWHEYKQMLARASGQTGIQPVDYASRTDMQRLAYEVGQSLKNLVNRGDPGISFNEFRLRVTRAMRNGEIDELTDSATDYVNREASAQRQFYNKTRDLAVEHGVFDEAYAKSRDLALSEVNALKKEADEVARRSRLEKWDPARTRAAEEALIARTEDAQFRLRQTEEELKRLRDNGPALNGTAKGYVPRLWDVGELTRNEQNFVTEISDWLKMKSQGTLDTPEAVRIAKEIHGLVSRQNPVFERGDMEALFKSVASPSSAMARSLQIPDKLIEKYLINDSEVLLRYHARQMGTAIEMKQRFGSLDLKEQIAEVQQEYRALARRAEAEAGGVSDAYKAEFEAREGVPWAPLPPVADIEKMGKGAIEDMQVLRDRLYGTHGASADPHNWTSRTIRMAKQFANITLLGMSGVSSLGDFVRPLMTEGLDSMYGHGLRTLMSDSRATIMNLARKDMELAGTGMDLMNNVRALQAADTGDVFGSRGRLEHALGQANNWFFVANGLNQLTEWSKRWSSIMIQGRMNEALMGLLERGAVDAGQLNTRFASLADNELQDLITTAQGKLGGKGLRAAESQALRSDIVAWERELEVRAGPVTGQITDPTTLARLASFNIDEVMGRNIALQLKIYGQQFDNIRLANLGEWTDEVASEMYKSMLYQSINRTVVTPGLGDRATWMSTELGSLVSQYKAWGVANLIRSLQSGLQEGGNAFWYGAAAAVGFAILLNEVKSRLFYDHSTFDRPATAVIADGVDRSSILGWFSDANRAVETLTGNRLGFKPLMGAVNPKPLSAPDIAGTLGGPAAGQAVRAGSVLNDFIRDHPTAKTYNNWRTLFPGNTLPYLDPVYDRAISDGNFRRAMERSDEKKRRLLQE